MEIIKGIWPSENPFPSLGKDIILYLKENLDKNLLNKINFNKPEIFKYYLRTLPNEIQNGIATSIIFSSWNAATYVNQISDDKVLIIEQNSQHVKHIQEIVTVMISYL